MNIKNKLLILVRHAERADMIENVNLQSLMCTKFDTEITEIGKIQSELAGKNLRKFCERNSIDLDDTNSKQKIIVASSPFVRTLITSSHMIKGMGIDTPIYIENGLCEHLNPKWYNCPPEDFLISYKTEYCDKQKYLEKELKNNTIINKSITNLPEFP
jgi:hypothetical protein